MTLRPAVLAVVSLSVFGACDSGAEQATDTTTADASAADEGGSTVTVAPTTTSSPPAPSTAPPTTEMSTQVLPTVPDEGSVLDVVRSHPELTRLAALVDQLDQDGVFTQERGVTLFAPNDDALAALGEDALAALAADPTAVTLLLSEHLSIGTQTIDDLVGSTFSNAMARDLPVVSDGDVVTVDGIRVVESDLAATNGVVHVIDGVIAAADAG